MQKMDILLPGFKQLGDGKKFATLMCPTTPQSTKLVNRFIKLMFDKRGELDSGVTLMEM